MTCFVDDTPENRQEFKWLYTSWLYSDGPGVIVAFAHPNSVKSVSLPGVRVYETIPLSDLEDEWAKYKYINSIYYLTTQKDHDFAEFTHILRTDCDCMITKYFPRVAPRLPLFGRGTYVESRDVANKLGDLAEKMGTSYTWNHNVGSSILAPVHTVLYFSEVQMEVCRVLLKEGFPDGPGEWPEWYLGVLTMYAGEIAANAIAGQGITIAGLDCMSMSDGVMGALDFHIHAFTADQDFSKDWYREGKYDGKPLASLDPSIINQYCMMIAKMSEG